MQMGRFGFEILGVAACAALVTACTAEAGDVGTIGVALTASDASGTTYRLTPGARLIMSGGTFYDEFALDGDQAVVRIDVPPGDYTAELFHDAGHTVQWPLERRTPDGTTDTVWANLVTPMPAPVTITTGGLTNLVLRFELPDLGLITFDEGSVNVSIEVVGSTPSSLDVGLVGALDVSAVTVDPAAPAALAPRLPAVGATAIGFDLAGHISGPWTKSSATGACAPVTLAASSNHAGIADLLTEAGADASFCVDASGGAVSGELVALRAGTPTTATFTGLGDGNYLFVSLASVTLPAAVFDGERLDLDPLVGVHTYPATALTRVSVRAPGATTRTVWYRASYSGQLALSLTPGTAPPPPMP